MKSTKTTQYRVFVCDKQRSPQSLEGCCYQCGSMDIYHAFLQQIKELGLQNEVEVRTSGCLDRCESGVVVLICQTQREKFSWLPKKIRIKLRDFMFPNKSLYGNLNANDIPALVRSHFLNRQVLKKNLL
jgi:(2Fe-2S) ferredoxin